MQPYRTSNTYPVPVTAGLCDGLTTLIPYNNKAKNGCLRKCPT